MAEQQFAAGVLAPQGPARGVIVPDTGIGVVPETLPCPSCGGGGGFPASAYFPGNQQAQQTSYWCGPAAVHEALGDFGINISQSTLAGLLGTTSAGTGWLNSGGPVPDVMNNVQSVNDYAPQPISSASSSVIAQYEEDLMADVYGMGAPVIGDADEVVGGPHLVGHPNENIMHWFEIRGYTSSGTSTMYEDSVHNATSVSWYAGVPAYSTLQSHEIVSIVSGRGYVW